MFKSKFLQEAEARGLLFQCTNLEELDNRLANERVVAYWGTDPTGAALHIGHLYSLMMMRLFQKCGHKPIILVGGATGLVGDPSMKDKSRPMLSRESIAQNIEGIKASIKKFIRFGDGETDAVLVNNLDWTDNLNYLEVLREIGPFVSVNRMLSFESVKQRLQKEEHMSFLEFNYMILQSYDFYQLYKKYNCTLQLCGADQWGNVVAGVELVRRLEFKNNQVEKDKRIEVFGLSSPLLTDSNGKKMGKSEGNAIWLNEDLLSPFDYFQFFRNVNDADVVKLLRVYTDFSVEEIKKLEEEAKTDINQVKKILAFEATRICHGEEKAKEALTKAESIFEGKSFEDLDVLEYNLGDNNTITTLLNKLGFVASNGEARRLIAGGGVKINDEKVADANLNLRSIAQDFKLSIGKKKHYRIKLK